MPNALQTAGSQGRKQTAAAPIFVNEMFTGLWTQRNPLRDAATAYLIAKFYSGTRFDSLIDGLNIEISPKLTLKRRCGASVYNSQTFPAINRFYEFRLGAANVASTIRVMADTASTVYDATGPSSKTAIFTKGTGAGQTYFQSVGNTLYMADGVEQFQWVQSILVWAASTVFTAGQYLIDPSGNLQLVTTGGTSGGSVPSWNGSLHGTTTDGGVTWTNEGGQVQNWGIKGVAHLGIAQPSLSLSSGMRYWYASVTFPLHYTIIDTNGNIQFVTQAGATGTMMPNWAGNPNIVTPDNGVTWRNAGLASASWQPSTGYVLGFSPQWVIVDSNGNYQYPSTGGTSGTSQPSWNASVGGTTTDGTVTWTNIGNGTPVLPSNCYYCLSQQNSVTLDTLTATPLQFFPPAVGNAGQLSLVLSGGLGVQDTQVGQFVIFRSAYKGAIPFFLTSITPAYPNWTYTDTSPDSALNSFIEAPLSHSNDAPPKGLTNLCFHLGRIMGSVGNTVYWSGGPDTAYGNGNTAWPPANNFVMPDDVTRIVPLTNGALIFTVADVHYSPNSGPNADIPGQPVPYMQGKVGGLLSYNALDLVGSTIYLINSKKMVKSIDISNGEAEIGFPIGDVLANGGSLAPKINPASCYVAYHEQDSTDTGLYLATPGAANSAWWYRMNATPAPESGVAWSTVAQSKSGFSAVQSIETSPGIHQLLMGPASSGKILFRDPTTFQDNGTPYLAYADIGSLVLAHPGQVALLYFITTDCVVTGTRPTISVLMNEIGGHPEMLLKGSKLPINSFDPPQLGPVESSTIYNDRWWLSGSQKPAMCRHLQIEVSWPAVNEPSELLTYTLFGEHYQEL